MECGCFYLLFTGQVGGSGDVVVLGGVGGAALTKATGSSCSTAVSVWISDLRRCGERNDCITYSLEVQTTDDVVSMITHPNGLGFRVRQANAKNKLCQSVRNAKFGLRCVATS